MWSEVCPALPVASLGIRVPGNGAQPLCTDLPSCCHRPWGGVEGEAEAGDRQICLSLAVAPACASSCLAGCFHSGPLRTSGVPAASDGGCWSHHLPSRALPWSSGNLEVPLTLPLLPCGPHGKPTSLCLLRASLLSPVFVPLSQM